MKNERIVLTPGLCRDLKQKKTNCIMFVIKIVLVCGYGFIQVDSKLGIIIIDPKVD